MVVHFISHVLRYVVPEELFDGGGEFLKNQPQQDWALETRLLLRTRATGKSEGQTTLNKV